MADRIEIHDGDITKLAVDAIVNAANTSLTGGGGVDGAIHAAAGRGLLEDCLRIGGCVTGDAVLTSGHLLPARYVIHAVGPTWHGGSQDEARLLASCYRRALDIAVEYKIRTIAFPAISTGAYGYPIDDACRVAVREIRTFLRQSPSIEKVILVSMSPAVHQAYQRALDDPGVCFVGQAGHGDPMLKSRLMGGILGAAVGDALGVPVEGAPRAQLIMEPVTAFRDRGPHNQPVGTWSDDTSLSLCTLDSLLHGYDPGDMMERFARWARNGENTPHGRVFDIGETTREAISRYLDGAPQDLWGAKSAPSSDNGSLMRILPVALYLHKAPSKVLIDAASQVSALTHATPRARWACAYYCLVIQQLMRGVGFSQAVQETNKKLITLIPPEEEANFAPLLSGHIFKLPQEQIQSSRYVMHTLGAALWVCERNRSYTSTVLAAVNLGDDTDTIGAVAGGLAGVMYGLRAVPKEWAETLVGAAGIARRAALFADVVLAR